MSNRGKKRIWHVGPHQDAQGGISTVIRLLLAEQESQPGIQVGHLATAVSGGKAAKFAIMVLAWFRLLFSGLLGQVDLLHVHTSSGVSLKRKAIFMKLGRQLGIPCILHIHGSNFDQWYDDAPAETQQWIRNQLDQSVGIVALSDSWKQFLSPLTSTPVHVIYNSVPVGAFVWPRPERRPGPARLLFLGLLGKRKGSYDLLEAIHQEISSEDSVPVELKIGGDGEVEETLALVSQLGLESSVEYLGWVNMEQKVALLSETDIFVLPSYHEGLPMGILEAMAAGVAVLTTPINGIPEAVHHGKNGIFVDPGDVQALARAIRELAKDPEHTRKLGVTGRIEVESRFNISTAAEKLSIVYLACARS